MMYLLLTLVGLALCVGISWGYVAGRKEVSMKDRSSLLFVAWVVLSFASIGVNLWLVNQGYFSETGPFSALLIFFAPFFGPIIGRALKEDLA